MPRIQRHAIDFISVHTLILEGYEDCFLLLTLDVLLTAPVTPAKEDITLSDKQRDRLRSNVLEIQQEATHRQVEFREVHTVHEAAKTIVAMA
jgi:hypothetical protein